MPLKISFDVEGYKKILAYGDLMFNRVLEMFQKKEGRDK